MMKKDDILTIKIEDMGIDGATDFRDETHLSDEGAKKVARFLGDYLNGR